ncbi:MAG: DedA family protein [Bacteriovoracaceae bacterium]|nr:DedA family protein [Bacteriovoracaceae bacterium]
MTSKVDSVNPAKETIDQSKGLLRRWYNSILESCNSPIATVILGIVSFTESCCFIIPPEVMQLPMSYANRKKAFYYAFITTVTSVLGAIAGYYMGAYLWEEIQPLAFSYIPGFAKHFDHVGELYKENAVSALFLAAFTPIPFKVFTVAAGVYSTKISITILIATSIVGRGARYFILSALVYFLGDKAQNWIEKHFKTFTIVVGALVILLVLFLKLRH